MSLCEKIKMTSKKETSKKTNLNFHMTLARIAIAAQMVFLHSCIQAVFLLRHPDVTYKHLYPRDIAFLLILLLLISTWMIADYRYEPDMSQRRKNAKIEFGYGYIHTFIGLLTIHFEIGLAGLALIVTVYAAYIFYIIHRN